MDAARKTHINSRLLLLIALAFVLSAPGWSQAPAFTLSTSTVNFNQSATGTSVAVGSNGASITFAPSIAYASDGGNGHWLSASADSGSTPANLGLNVVNTGGMGAGTYTATVTLTASAPAGVANATITVSFQNGSGGGGGGGGTAISVSSTNVAISASGGNLGFGNVTVTTSSLTSINISASATTNNGINWLTPSLSNSTVSSGSSSNLNIQANAGLLNAGTYQGTVTVTPSTGSAVTVTVTFTVGGGGSGGSLSASPNPINWNYNSGSGNFPAQSISVSSSSGASSYTATSNTGWLLLNGVGSVTVNLSSSVTASLGSAVGSLATGSYTGTITITDNFGISTAITVNLTVNGGSSTGLSITPSSLNLTAAVGGQAQFNNLTVISSTGGAFTASSNASWLGALVTTGSPIASNTSGTVQVTVIPGGLASGTYTGSVTVFAGAQSQAIPVTLTVGSGGGGGGGGGTTSGVSPNSVSLNWQSGTNPAFVNRPVLSITGTSGAWSSTIAYGQGSGWLSLNPSSGNSLPDQTTVVVDPSGLAAGNYTATITINTPGGPQTVNVNLAVAIGPVLLSTPGGLIFNYQTGTNPPAGQSLFFNSSDGTAFELAGNVTTNVPWLTISPIQTGQKSFSVMVDPTGLTGGVYSGAVSVGASTLPSASVPVVLVINGGSGGGGGSGPLTFSSNGLAFSTAGGANPASQVLGVSAASQTSFSVSTNQTWLSVTPNSGTTNTNLIVSINSASLPAGTYNGTIAFNSSGILQNVSVSLTVGSGGGGGTGNVTVTPAIGLTFTAQTGSGVLPVQSLQINSASGSAPVNFTVNATTTSGGNWLSTSANSGFTLSTPQTLTITVNTAGLAAGTYQGNVQISPNSGTVVNVPITLNLTAPASVSVPSTPLTFSYRAGGANPASQQLAVSGNGGTLSFTATASSTGNWLSVSPTSGSTPATITVSVNGAGLSAGTYNGSVTVAGSNGAPGSTTVQVTLTVSVPLPTILRLGNAGSYAAASIAPGEIITLFGTDIGPATPAGLALDSTGKVATTLAGVQVAINGFLAPMIYVSNTQVSAVVPYELAQFASANVLVKFLGQSSNGIAINVTTTAPGLFTLNSSGTGPGAILNQDNSTNTPSNPAVRGQTVVVYLTGEGQTTPPGVTGKVTTVGSAPQFTPAPLLTPSVMIGGQPAQFSYAGEAPGFISGVMQLNVIVPLTVGTGDQSIVVTMGGRPSQSGVTVSLR